MKFGFVGPTYRSQSPNVDASMAMNFYPEFSPNPTAKTPIPMYQTPGLVVFSTLPGMLNVRQELFFQGRFFAVAEDLTNQVLWEVTSLGAPINRGTLSNAGTPVSMSVNNRGQIMITSAGRLFLFDMATNLKTEIATTGGTALQGRVAKVGFTDSYFIALLANSQKFQISAQLDGSSWDPADIAQVSVYPDNVLSMLVDHREIWLWGSQKTVVYADSGNPLFPFDVLSGAFIEQGIVAPESPVRLDNSVFWLGGDERGAAVAWRAQGYTPQRVSDHDVEFQWQGYSTVADAEGYPYQDQGHSFWVLRFPTADKTWVYDVATNMWHERGYFNAGTFNSHHSRCHAFAFGKHLVGDWASGKIYQMSIAFNDDAGNPIKRIRRAPHFSDEQKWMLHHELQVDVETGLGPSPPLLDGLGNPRGPQMVLRWSDDGGHTWSNDYSRDCGQAGDYKKRVIWRRLGRSRDRVYEVSVTDPVPWRIVDAYLNAGT